jgi:hypothetical protein
LLDPISSLQVGCKDDWRYLGSKRRVEGEMTDVAVQTMRTVDRDWLLQTLAEHGHEARPIGDGLAVEVSCDSCEELYSDLEHLVGELGLPLVPILVDNAVILRPPGS